MTAACLGERRVAVTAETAVTAAGLGSDRLWEALAEGRACASRLPLAPGSSWPVDIACQVPGFDPTDWMPRPVARRSSRAQQLAVAAFRLLLEHDGALDGVDLERAGVSVGTCFGGLHLAEKQARRLQKGGWRMIDPFFAAGCLPNTIPGSLAIDRGLRGPNMCPSTACASGASAIADACTQIVLGRADAMVAGGVDAPLHELAFASFQRMGVLSQGTDDPGSAARPFDRRRDGFVLGEGAALVLLEEMEHARRRGAPILGEVAGWATNADAFHVVAPARYGSGARRCMRAALEDSGLSAADVGHVNAHGTGTVANDAAEAAAIGAVFGSVPTTAPKSVVGHCMGAAGAIEVVATLLAARHGVVPPTASTDDVPPELGIDLVTKAPRIVESPVGLSNSFALGGQNVSLVLRAVR